MVNLTRRFIQLSFIFLGGCSFSLPAIKNEFNQSEIQLKSNIDYKTHSKIVFYNLGWPRLNPDHNPLPLNIYINGKGVCQLEILEYYEIVLPNGQYDLKLMHWDAFTFTSSDSVTFNGGIYYAKLYATTITNKYSLSQFPPAEFNKTYKKKEMVNM